MAGRTPIHMHWANRTAWLRPVLEEDTGVRGNTRLM